MGKERKDEKIDEFSFFLCVFSIRNANPYCLIFDCLTRQKGVSKANAEKSIKLVSEDGESRLALAKLSMYHILVQGSKQWLQVHDVPKETHKSRKIHRLQSLQLGVN
ncbi:hypothetical protein MANES_05G203050v8 [Manihot esculenta]|uniref:Uncharacterized protein n=1 Tax=Manihot esculenta TaxID=3983 RepID=A0ACB7HSW0_MANES|nr:hypothetical protein MANES_05G203050v8 [Manihot esculenta]